MSSRPGDGLRPSRELVPSQLFRLLIEPVELLLDRGYLPITLLPLVCRQGNLLGPT